jgi:uncharacterized protein (DUF1810 family)
MADDAHDLQRFVLAQDPVHAAVLAELRAGRKRTHWMWFVFPQCAGLGTSEASRHYAIRSLAEARAYLGHPLLGPRLVECCDVLLAMEGKDATAILGTPDDLKLRSCATLFARVSPPDSVYGRILDRFFEGVPDERTMRWTG